jgi:hypothetical protein
MKVIGIDIRGSKAFFVALERIGNSIEDVTGNFTSLELKDHKDSAELRRYQDTIFDFLRGIASNTIGILSKNTGGKFQGSSVSFKIEGLIQCYPEMDIEIVSPNSVAAFQKKNELTIVKKFAYQEEAARLAAYLIQRK